MSKQTFRTVLKSFRKLVGSFYVIGTMPGPSKTSCWVVYRDWLNLPLVCCLQAESRISYCMIHTTRLLERGTWHIMTDMFLIFYLASEAGSSLEGKFGVLWPSQSPDFNPMEMGSWQNRTAKRHQECLRPRAMGRHNFFHSVATD